MQKRSTAFPIIITVLTGLFAIGSIVEWIVYFHPIELIFLPCKLFLFASIIVFVWWIDNKQFLVLCLCIALLTFIFPTNWLPFVIISSAIYVAVATVLLLFARKNKRTGNPANKEPTSQEAFEKIQKLRQLADAGIITQEEFTAKSADLINYL